jgi:hypothetical protein
MTWSVKVIESATGKVVKEMKVNSERQADRIETGLSINLNHEKFHTEVDEITEVQHEQTF